LCITDDCKTVITRYGPVLQLQSLARTTFSSWHETNWFAGEKNLEFGLHSVTSIYFDLKATTEILGLPAAFNNMFDCNCHKQCKSSFSICASAASLHYFR
jgi:hypothetical protein